MEAKHTPVKIWFTIKQQTEITCLGKKQIITGYDIQGAAWYHRKNVDFLAVG
jgi:hypothetical protein